MWRGNWPVLGALLLFLTACGRPAYPLVSLAESGTPAPAANPDEPRKLPLRVAVAAVISPKATLEAYASLLNEIVTAQAACEGSPKNRRAVTTR